MHSSLVVIISEINQSINGGDGCRHQCASISVSYFLHFTRIQINLITTSILRLVSSSGKISCVIKNNILVNPIKARSKKKLQAGASRGIPGDADCVLKILGGQKMMPRGGIFFNRESINTCRKQRNAKQCACNSASINCYNGASTRSLGVTNRIQPEA